MAELVDAHASGACWLSQWKFESRRIDVALMAELVDAHASGACWLSQWKFESSSGHHKKASLVEVFLWCIV